MLITLIIIGGLLWLVHEHRQNKKAALNAPVTSTMPGNTNLTPSPTPSSNTEVADPTSQTFEKVASGNYTFSFVTPDKLTRTYVVHIPKNYDPAKAYPVLFGFHGGFGHADQFEQSSQFSPLADQRGFIVVYGQGTEWGLLKAPVWNGGACCGQAVDAQKNVDDVGYVRTIVTQIKAKYHIDSKRIYTTGMSNGAIFSNRLACEAADIFAGAAPVSGTMQITTCTPSKQMPILMIQGTADTNVPYEGGPGSGLSGATFIPVVQAFADWAKRNACTGPITTTVIPPLETTDGHTIDKLEYGNCAQPTVLYRINGGIHEWPSGDLNANRATKQEPSKALNASKTIADFFGL